MTRINFAGIVDHSTLDYPGKSAAVLYLCGCPFRCPWCQNRELVLEEENCKLIEIDEILKQLKENFLLDAVCVTGGEPLLQEETIELLKRIKSGTKLLLKIDTNCYFPDMLEKAIPYLDFFTTDIKAPLDERYGRVAGLPEHWEEIVVRVRKSLSMLKEWNQDKEARTTIVPGLIDSMGDIEEIAKVINDTGFSLYTLQQFRAERTLNPEYEKIKSPSVELMHELGEAAKKHLPDVKVQIVTEKNGFEEIH
ncbi:MAG: anaerobic ribonucleoside-triphosphate reductase activating protein [Candidatus Altiarchaeales archaeon]|nr:anaerobic ribonucleoside-triphosphate reductase activating protein [Candidatus Altiarchaeota archaeon]MCG2782083.1 anaerobic ribonucleoside-triphosphate reductase activating protein [Candidatus Altiarchaeales archaeon]MBU4266138.1 anaerobic ribonucleoside-triphosphate reductase activating protein [Candidatus Altiarchaeota archaeon]MBU4341039.1 anaerobic ribonucleoside-triphosphate reductase activating protein [Candidatus Altiarchaeota archaeon]MBU4406082.1 anaerobic ribonucleoside-triphospha